MIGKALNFRGVKKFLNLVAAADKLHTHYDNYEDVFGPMRTRNVCVTLKVFPRPRKIT